MAAKDFGSGQSAHRQISLALPPGYSVYVVGVQECVSSAFFDSIQQHLEQRGCVRLPINARVEGRGDGTESS